MKKGDIEKMKIGIIGAGYGGLNIAKELEKNGQEVTLFEKKRCWRDGRHCINI